MHPTSVTITADPLQTVVVSRAVSTRVERTSGGTTEHHDVGELFLIADPHRAYTLRRERGEMANVVLDPAVLARVAATAPGRRSEPIRFTGLGPLSGTMAAHWWAARTYVAGMLDNPDAAAAPLILSEAANLLATATLATFPNTALTDPTVGDRHDATSATLRRAVAFIDAHPADDITVTDIAVAARVSVRAVQLAFRRHLDTTPMTHLRRVRLEQAHRELVAGDPRHTTVSAVALRWGFGSHSRFTALYHLTYGVPPRITLAGH